MSFDVSANSEGNVSGNQDLEDPFMLYMNSKGYMPIILPKGGVTPPVVMTLQDGHYTDTRELAELLAARKLSTEGLNAGFQPAAGFEKELANNQSGKVSVGLFGSILSKLGLGGDPTIKAHADHGDKTKFQFQDVYVKGTLPGVIRDRIRDLQPEDFDEADLKNGKVYVAYQYVYAKKLIVGTGNNMAAGFEAKAQIEGTANIELSASGNSVRIDVTAYNGNEPLAFGFKAGQLTRPGGKYHFDWNMPKGVNLRFGREEPLVFKNTVFKPAET
jgi:hypothetical protein